YGILPVPEISVSMTGTRTGPDVCISGKGFSRTGKVQFNYGKVPPLGYRPGGLADISFDGTFRIVDLQKGLLGTCLQNPNDPYHPNGPDVEVKATDQTTQATATVSVPAGYFCWNRLTSGNYQGGCK